MARGQLETLNQTLKGNADRLASLFEGMLPDGVTVSPDQTVDVAGKPAPVTKNQGRLPNMDFRISPWSIGSPA